jgi:HlyD family secretion protein
MRAASADVDASRAQVAQQRWQVDKKMVSAPTAGEISETYYREGEWVAAGQPVVSLLPNNRRIIRFFVPESVIASIKPGGLVEASCDGCTTPIKGTINFISPQAEYTPPVIYSHGSREKMVFRIEALPSQEQATLLRPGLPIDVHLIEH